MRFYETPIPGTVWDDYEGDYRSLSDVDWEAPDTKEFLDTFYPNLVAELSAWSESLHRDIPADPLLREFGYYG